MRFPAVSDDARLMVHPFRTYAALGDGEVDLRTALGRVARLMLLLGVFVSLLAAGRLVPFHVVSPFVFWAYIPIVHTTALFAAHRLVVGKASKGSFIGAVGLHFLGFGPWLVVLLGFDAVLLFSPDPLAAFGWLLGHGILAAALFSAIGWGITLTFALFRAGFALSRARAAAATAIFYAVYSALILSYYFGAGQLGPLLFQ